MNYHHKIIGCIEVHDVSGIIECFNNGVSANDNFRDKPLINELLSEYGRGPAFKKCVKAFADHGLQFADKALLAVLLDDESLLRTLLENDKNITTHTISFRSAYTPLLDASLLHVCAEFNHLNCAKLLIQHGADINCKAGIDENGFGGQTPIFHTVNQNGNMSADMLSYLLELSADLHFSVPGIIWGKGYPWETFIPSVNPVSYAMMGLLPQMHRSEKTISETVSRLMKAAYNIDYLPTNIPCAYLR